MRPVRRGANPTSSDFADYDKAKPDLISRLGQYCSYCERRIATNLAVEHIQSQHFNPHLTGTWTNFLLACVNCNSTKSAKPFFLLEVLLPDRDNTFAAFIYTMDGRVEPSSIAIGQGLFQIAQNTLALTGLDKKSSVALDENGKEIAIDRVSQRKELWLIALDAKNDVDLEPNSETTKKATLKLALATGFFSIWMKVFENDIDMRNRLIDAFAGTRESGCFDPMTTALVSPAPNPDGLDCGGKI
jgi:uncharacterized protein (TIGR02646 family)